jgi:DNA-binding NtrC family response regulator
MPASIVIVHDDATLAGEAMHLLRLAGHRVVALNDQMTALEVLREMQEINLLITRVFFGQGKLNGIALARMARYRRPATKVIFAALTQHEQHADGVGEFLSLPVRAEELAAAAERVLRSLV